MSRCLFRALTATAMLVALSACSNDEPKPAGSGSERATGDEFPSQIISTAAVDSESSSVLPGDVDLQELTFNISRALGQATSARVIQTFDMTGDAGDATLSSTVDVDLTGPDKRTRGTGGCVSGECNGAPPAEQMLIDGVLYMSIDGGWYGTRVEGSQITSSGLELIEGLSTDVLSGELVDGSASRSDGVPLALYDLKLKSMSDSPDATVRIGADQDWLVREYWILSEEGDGGLINARNFHATVDYNVDFAPIQVPEGAVVSD